MRRLLSNPLTGFAPWIVMSVVVGPGRLELAAILAFELALLIAGLGLAIGMRPKLLDLAGMVFFGALIVAGLVVDDSGVRWLQRWSGDLSNAVIALVALVSIVIRRPFTMQYARETTDRQYWSSPLFVHVNYVLTWAWCAAFLIAAAVGYVGDGPLGQPDNLWTDWLVQIAVIVVALRFTAWYPDHAAARADGRARQVPSVWSLVRPLAELVVPVGIAVLVVGGAPAWVGIALIVFGVVVTYRLRDGTVAQETR